MTENTVNDWDKKRDALIAEMQKLQGDIADQREYRRRLVETGLQAKWDALMREPGAHQNIVTVGETRK